MKEMLQANARLLLLSVLILSSSTPALAYYHPEEGRWISRDPIGERSSLNLFVAFLNAPIVFVDPLGLDVENKSDCPVVVKPENDKDPPIVIPPGGKHTGTQDGVYPCCGDDCKVYKTANGINVTVNADSNFTPSGGTVGQKIVHACIGGCKDDKFLKDNPNWPSKDKVKELCDAAKKKEEGEKDKEKMNPVPPTPKP